MPGLSVDEVRRDLAALRTEFMQLLGDRDRLEEDRFNTLHDGQTTISATLEQMNGKVARLSAEIGPGLPEAGERGNRETIRDRLHKVEQDRTMIDGLSQTLVGQIGELSVAVKDMQSEREKARIEREAQEKIRTQIRADKAKQWTRAKVIFVTACTGVGACGAIIGATFTVLRYAGHGG